MNNELISGFENLIVNEYSNIAGIAVIKNDDLIYGVASAKCGF